jgi:glycosidase
MFNSRSPVYRNPIGAVADGTNIHFKISLSRDLRCSAATLSIFDDETKQTIKSSMFWCGMNGDNAEWWECDFTPKKPGLCFYHFVISSWRGALTLSRSAQGDGVFSIGGEWQLTVYDRNFQTPDWLAGGVMYQIFPDRFYNSGEPKANVPQDRKLHTIWGEQPDWQPNEQGVITNTDYFGGDLKGIAEKLGYLKSLGVTCLYLNPIFESHSNHRYDTADYSKVDPLLGIERDFRDLCEQAKALGIHVLLDGVFSHTGSDSVYFNRKGRYGENEGAYRSQKSPYYSWYTFKNWPNQYDCWWNFITLPNVTETNPQYNQYINGKDGIIQKWIESGSSGWRLDVADELPDEFLDKLRVSAKEKDPNALILGEVWEDASNKTAYGYRRKYLLGGQLDSVMNYPFRNAILGFLIGSNPADMMEIILNVLENYPPQVVRLLMNHIGTHDTERALTMLAGEPIGNHERNWQSTAQLSKENRAIGLRQLRLAALMQFTLPGVPCIYYGDEAGMEGYRDPFNRGCYPWGEEDQELLAWYRSLGKMRAECSALKEGRFIPLTAGDSCMVYMRRDEKQMLLVAVNAADKEKYVAIPSEWRESTAIFGQVPLQGDLKLPPLDCVVLKLSIS